MAEKESVTIEEVSKYLNFNPTEDWEKVKAQLDETYVKATAEAIEQRSELYGSILGKANHEFLKTIKKFAKDAGVEVTWSEFEGKKSTEVLEEIGQQITGKVSEYTETLAEKEKEIAEAKKSGASAKDVEKLTAELETWKNKHEETEGLLNTTKTQFEEFQNNVEAEKKQFKISQFERDAWNNIKLATKSDYERKGFEQELKSKYQLELDNDNLVVKDKEGKRIPNPTKHGEFMGWKDVIEHEAKGANLLDENPHSGKQPKNTPPPPIPSNNGEGKKYVRPQLKSSFGVE